MSALATHLFLQMDLSHFHAAVHCLAHIIDGKQCHVHPGQCLHLYAGTPG